MKRSRVSALDAILLIVALLVVMNPSPAWAGWADNNCGFQGNGTDLSNWKKSQAMAYADVALGEGYHYGGGCWNNNGVDAQPNDPTLTESTHGEGGDCSGLTFKSWALENTYGQNGKQYWNDSRYLHGPYSSLAFKNPPGSPINDIAKANAYEMEALAYNDGGPTGHVAMIWTPNTSQGQDRVIQAKCEACGTIRNLESYRSESRYEAAQRTGWTPECFPQCV